MVSRDSHGTTAPLAPCWSRRVTTPIPTHLSYLRILSYTLVSLNCRWFTFAILLARALEVVLPSGSWHPAVPCVSRRSLLSHSRRSLLSHSRSLLSHRRRSLLNQRRMLSTTLGMATTRETTPRWVSQMTWTQSQNQSE
jgi:hypothetical protein